MPGTQFYRVHETRGRPPDLTPPSSFALAGGYRAIWVSGRVTIAPHDARKRELRDRVAPLLRELGLVLEDYPTEKLSDAGQLRGSRRLTHRRVETEDVAMEIKLLVTSEKRYPDGVPASVILETCYREEPWDSPQVRRAAQKKLNYALYRLREDDRVVQQRSPDGTILLFPPGHNPEPKQRLSEGFTPEKSSPTVPLPERAGAAPPEQESQGRERRRARKR